MGLVAPAERQRINKEGIFSNELFCLFKRQSDKKEREKGMEEVKEGKQKGWRGTEREEREGWREGERERYLPSVASLPKWLYNLRLGQAQAKSLELHPSLPSGWKEPKE